jgi:hypothetical protein
MLLKMKVIYLIFCLSAALQAGGQTNVVSNYSFEDFTICPDNEGQISRTLSWYSSNNGTPDYFNNCSSNPNLFSSVPIHSTFYTKYPFNGNAYSGIVVFSTLVTGISFRENISIKLNNPLQKGKIYFVEFFTSPKDSISGLIVPCFIDKLGISISKNDPTEATLPNTPLKRQKYIGNEDKILDKIDEWTQISGCVTGDGEQYLTIGNFFTDAETKVGEDCAKYFPNSA